MQSIIARSLVGGNEDTISSSGKEEMLFGKSMIELLKTVVMQSIIAGSLLERNEETISYSGTGGNPI
jgi:hypothetical protein